MSKTKIISAGGIGESRTFNNPETAAEPHRMELLHINGVLISELALGPEILCALDYWCTDEGIQEKNARPDAREASGVTAGQDDYSKAMDERRHDVIRRDVPLYQARSPMKELADRFTAPGMRAKYLSADCIADGGTGDYVVVKYPEGHEKHGEPVRVRKMVLGEMPTEVAIARNEHYRARGNTLLKQIEQKHKSEGGLVDPG
jgi:hypothetical protein